MSGIPSAYDIDPSRLKVRKNYILMGKVDNFMSEAMQDEKIFMIGYLSREI